MFAENAAEMKQRQLYSTQMRLFFPRLRNVNNCLFNANLLARNRCKWARCSCLHCLETGEPPALQLYPRGWQPQRGNRHDGCGASPWLESKILRVAFPGGFVCALSSHRSLLWNPELESHRDRLRPRIAF